ncbi:MAG: YqgE/AlgH family protein [Alphaproteobacteria bacterium]|nr:YqgE/AlgH family protein [Alphaproteobacteria bacterium]
MTTIPRKARLYILFGVFFMALPGLLSLYHGQTGKILVSTNANRDGPFARTVIYLTRHDVAGAHGVILNKPVDQEIAPLRNLLPELSWNVRVFNGGPVEFADARFLMIPAEKTPNGFVVAPLEDLRADYPSVISDLESRKNSEPVRLFLGYAGWGPLQLNREIAKGVWDVIEYDPALVRDTPPADMWNRAAEKILKRRPVRAGRV